MFSVDLPKVVKQKIKSIAKEYGFKNIAFYPDFESGRSRSLYPAQSRDAEPIDFNFLFLSPVSKLYKLHPELLKKTTKVICLHERKHYDFNDSPNANQWEVNKRASLDYGDNREFAILDILVIFYDSIKYLEKEKIRKEISDYVNKFLWLSNEERKNIIDMMSDKKFYKKRNLKKVLVK